MIRKANWKKETSMTLLTSLKSSIFLPHKDLQKGCRKKSLYGILLRLFRTFLVKLQAAITNTFYQNVGFVLKDGVLTTRKHLVLFSW